MTRASRGKPTEPKYYQQIFERGIDPDVEDPEQCHSHSEIPDEWPPLDEILDYQERVRGRARSLLEKGAAMKDRTIGEALWIGFEHEAMHLETFLYMLLQSDRTIPPIGADPPDFAHMSWMAKKNKKPNSWFHIPQQTLTVGLDDPNDKIMPKESFGWDNEKPQRTISVHAFEAQARPITNGEYAKYLQANGLREYPASWVLVREDKEYPIPNGVTQSSPSASEDFLNNFAVRTVFGSVSLDLAQDWPLISSYDEVASYAKWMGCRIPTFEEAKSIYAYSDKLQGGASNGASNGLKVTEQRAPQVAEANGASSNGANGANGSSSNGVNMYSSSLFRDLRDSNIGFKHWHPLPVTPNGDKLAGQGDMGGVWEWTSSPLLPHEGFKAMEIYPGYTCELLYSSLNNYPEMLTLNYSGLLRREA
jgi:formylglycine-generating enzyme required for sulfatase activity